MIELLPFMDSKALDHLDPKQQEAYARIMGHANASDNPSQSPTQPNTDSIPTADFMNTPTDALSGTPNSTPTADFNSSPLDTPLEATAGDQPQFYTPGQESQTPESDAASLSTDPGQLSDQLTGSPFASSSFNDSANNTPEGAVQDNLTPPNSSFFSNPSPAETLPSGGNETLSEPISPEPEGIPASSPDNFSPGAPITPYTPSEVPNLAPVTETFSQPLPSPASVTQEENKEASPLLRVLYILGAVTFFAVYTIFWIKVFNLPFLF